MLIDLAVAQILGGEAISDFQGLGHLGPVIGPVPSNPTVWRALAEVGELQLTRINTAVTEFRRHWWGLLANRPEGFPWLRVAGRELTGITVVDLDASIVFAASDKKNAQPTYKGGIGFCPNLATCDNTDDLLAIDPRPGNATSNCAADNITLLDLAVSRLPGRYRRRVLVRLDGAGFSHDLLEHIAAGGGVRGRDWEFLAIDHRFLLVTSANFSWSAEHGNVEFGVLVDNRNLTEAVEREMLQAEDLLYERVPMPPSQRST